jgi:protein phosphatase
MNAPKSPKAGGLWARLFGVQGDDEQAAPSPEAQSEEPVPAAESAPSTEEAPSNGELVVAEIAVEAEAEVVPVAEPPVAEAPSQPCAACGTLRRPGAAYCHDCGWMFPPGGPAQSSTASLQDDNMSAPTGGRLRDRYEIGALISERQGVQRHRGVDHSTGEAVVIVVSAATIAEAPIAEAAPVAAIADDEILPGFDDDIPVATPVLVSGDANWPSVAWEKALLENANHPVLPGVLDQFAEGVNEYLVVEAPDGTSLWDAWDDPDIDSATRYGWLQKVAAALQALHQHGAIYEGIRPDVIVIGDDGQPRINDLADVLPLPVPGGAPIKATLYTAPELILTPTSADARSDLYSFGAMLYSLEYLHHPLEEKDFERQFTPNQITERFPDVHPAFLRLINKTFCRDINTRFPTDEMTKSDPTGFTELIRTLEIAGRAFDHVRLDIAAWTTTGMVRTGNEDAFTVLHGVDARQDDLGDHALIFLCDGMGGYDAGEVAAAMTINEMRKFLLAHPLFASFTAAPEGGRGKADVKALQDIMRDALKHANKEVYNAARIPGKGKRGMGCTAECVYVDSRNVIAGHIGDSRVYHLHRGRLVQLTKDQTFVNRMVELGQLSAEEAEHHPRKNELQQAIGGQPDVNPGLVAAKMQRGDWVLVCSDGLTNHIGLKELETMLTREAAGSAEQAARRLLNLVNLRGATDNATIVVVRAS